MYFNEVVQLKMPGVAPSYQCVVNGTTILPAVTGASGAARPPFNPQSHIRRPQPPNINAPGIYMGPQMAFPAANAPLLTQPAFAAPVSLSLSLSFTLNSSYHRLLQCILYSDESDELLPALPAHSSASHGPAILRLHEYA